MEKVDLTVYVGGATHHICDLLDALTDFSEFSSVTLVTEAPVSDDRIELGWDAKIRGRFREICSPTAQQVDDYVCRSAKNSIHIFIGMRHLTCVVAGIAACLRLNRRFGLMHEPRVREGLKGKIRFLESWLTEGRLRRSAFVLAIGEHGPGWFLSTGYKPAQIFPFAYFVNGPREVTPAPRKKGALRIGYVGRLVAAKGILDVLAAVPFIHGDFQLAVVGAGDQADHCRAVARTDPRVQFLGTLPVAQVQTYLRDIDILIQPSRTTDDGWGAVVSEALLNGAAVIASSVVGASACLKSGWRGRIVEPHAPQAIALAVHALVAEGCIDDALRAKRMEWAQRRLTAEAGAAYLVDILHHLYTGGPRPASFLNG